MRTCNREFRTEPVTEYNLSSNQLLLFTLLLFGGLVVTPPLPVAMSREVDA